MAVRGRPEFVQQRTVTEDRVGAEQSFDNGQRPYGVSVVQTFTNAGQTIRTTVSLVDSLQARKRRAAQCDEHFLAPDLGWVVIERGQYAVDQPDPVSFTAAVHQASAALPGRCQGLSGRRPARIEGGADQRVQLIGGDRSRADQLEVGQHPGGSIG
ncbi:hypothetical protein C8K36_1011341 [Rhodococcus sp. OK519]|nr:hypothetical protein C8K36_1011341 [Rhodococcus sp. OK519]